MTSFNRWSKFAEAIARRLLVILFSMYYDDATLQDWASSGSNGKRHVAELMELLGSPWSPAKSQETSPEADFLGLLHNCSSAHLGRLA